MRFLDWLRQISPHPLPVRDDALANVLERAGAANEEALAVVNASRERRGAPALDGEALLREALARSGPARAIREAQRRIEGEC